MTLSGGAVDGSASAWVDAYAQRYPLYQRFTNRLESLIVDLLSQEEVDVIQTESRCKSIDSLSEKLSRKDYSPKGDPFDAVTDLTGVRVITYYSEDVVRIGAMLRREFNIDESKSDDKAALLAPNQFGYRSAHFVLTLSPERAKLSEWTQYSSLRAEVQVRTALQHAWAAVSHKLSYKASADAPEEVERGLFRLSALFELADKEFSNIRDDVEASRQQYDATVAQGNLNVPLDNESLTAYLEAPSPVVVGLAEGIEKRGCRVQIEAGSRGKRDRADLLAALRHYGIDSVAQLDTWLRDEPVVNRLLDSLLPENRREDWNFATIDDWITQLLIVERHTGTAPGRPWYAPDTTDSFERAIKAFRAH